MGMDISFTNWVVLDEMALMSRRPISIDEDDIAYLKQFPSHKWTRALQMRYGDLLFDALDSDGNLNMMWKDVRDVSILKDTFHVDTGMTRVIAKLKRLGYDFRGINKHTKTSLYYSIPEYGNMARVIGKLRSQSRDPENPEPNIVHFAPDWKKPKRDDPEPTAQGTQEKRDKFKEIWPALENYVRGTVQDAEFTGHSGANVRWWQIPKNLEELVNKIRENTWQYWNKLAFEDLSSLRNYVRRQLESALQSGVVGRGAYGGFKSRGLDIHSLYSTLNPDTKKHWTPHEIKKIVASSPDYDVRMKMFNMPSSATGIAA